jgi:hypothetical protein
MVATLMAWVKATIAREVLAGEVVGIKDVHDHTWLVSFMDYDLRYFDLETRVLEPLENPDGLRQAPKPYSKRGDPAS